MAVGLITTKGKNIAMDRLYNGGTYQNVEYVQLGMCNKIPTVLDTKLFAPIPVDTTSNETIDACDATTGWNVSGDATSVSLDTTAGNRLEGTGSLDLLATYNTGIASYYKTVSSFSIVDKYAFSAFYLNDLTKFTNSSSTFSIDLGTGGFTNYNTYNFNYSQLQTGWNALVLNGNATPDSVGGSGATSSGIDRIRLNLEINQDLVADDIYMDWIHTYPIADTFITWSSGYPTFNETNKTATTRFTLNSLQANGYIIRELGLYDADKTYLYRRDKFTTINKDQYITLTYDVTDKIN